MEMDELRLIKTGATHWVRQGRQPPYQNFSDSRRF